MPFLRRKYIYYVGEGRRDRRDSAQSSAARIARLDVTHIAPETFRARDMEFGAGDLDMLVGTQMLARATISERHAGRRRLS